MLSKDQIEILTDKYITKLYDDLEREVISDIARRVKKMERFTETAELQAMAMREQGYSPSKIQQQVFKRLNADEEYQKQLAENTKEYKQEIKKIIEETVEAAEKAGDKLVATAGDMAWNDDMQAWKKHGVDLKKPNGLKQLYAGITKQTNGDLKNITQSTGFKGTTLGTTGVLNAYRRTMDLATLKMSTGAFSYQTAVKDCVKMLADSGLRNIDYASGRSYQLDTAARMCIRTGMNQLAGKIMELNLQETSTPLVYVDAHAGARPEHAEWQGQVYAYDPEGELKDGSKAGDKYGNFFDETDYGSVTGLMGANCAHHFYPYWEGDSIPEYKEPDPIEIEGKEYTYYEATQEMRRQERNIRKTKRNIEAMNTLGEDTTELKKKARLQEKAYLDFSKAAKINPRQYALTVPFGISKVPNQQQPEEEAHSIQRNSETVWQGKPIQHTEKVISSLIQYAKDRKIVLDPSFKSFDGDISLVEEFIDTLDKNINTSDHIRKKNVRLSVSYTLDDDTYAMTKASTVTINGFAFRSREILSTDYQDKVDEGWFTKDSTLADIAVHESAHVLVYLNQLKTSGVSEAVFGRDKVRASILIADEISEYASKNDHELIAESHVAHKNGLNTENVLKVLKYCGIL